MSICCLRCYSSTAAIIELVSSEAFIANVWAVDACLIHHVVIKVVQLLHEVSVTIKNCLFSLVQFLQVFLHLQMCIEIKQTLPHYRDEFHLVEEDGIKRGYILFNV